MRQEQRMTKRSPLLLVVLGLLPGCGHKADPLPPLRHTPPPLTSFRLAQRGELLELEAIAPAASVDGVAYTSAGVEFLHVTGEADLEKAGRRLPVRVAPGARASVTLSLPAPGTLVRAAARGLQEGERGPRSLTMALVAQPPVEAPRELAASLGEAGIELGWKGARPKEVPSPVGPKAGQPGPPGAGKLEKPGQAGDRPTPAEPRVPAPPAAPAEPPSGPPPEPAAGEPASGRAAESPPAEVKPAEARAGEAKPGEATAGEAKPGDPKTVQAPPARRSGFFVYRRAPNAAYAAPLFGEPLERRAFRDEGAPLGATWCYVVRAVASTEPLIESAASNEACLERRDVTPPATPAGLAVLPREGGLELLWSPSGEEDLAGYRVYRAVEGQAPERLAELEPAKAAYLDASAGKGVVYQYTLTAFDRAGNESPPAEAVSASLP